MPGDGERTNLERKAGFENKLANGVSSSAPRARIAVAAGDAAGRFSLAPFGACFRVPFCDGAAAPTPTTGGRDHLQPPTNFPRTWRPPPAPPPPSAAPNYRSHRLSGAENTGRVLQGDPAHRAAQDVVGTTPPRVAAAVVSSGGVLLAVEHFSLREKLHGRASARPPRQVPQGGDIIKMRGEGLDAIDMPDTGRMP